VGPQDRQKKEKSKGQKSQNARHTGGTRRNIRRAKSARPQKKNSHRKRRNKNHENAEEKRAAPRTTKKKRKEKKQEPIQQKKTHNKPQNQPTPKNTRINSQNIPRRQETDLKAPTKANKSNGEGEEKNTQPSKNLATQESKPIQRIAGRGMEGQSNEIGKLHGETQTAGRRGWREKPLIRKKKGGRHGARPAIQKANKRHKGQGGGQKASVHAGRTTYIRKQGKRGKRSQNPPKKRFQHEETQ